MMNILKIIKDDLTLGKIITNVLTNAIISFLLYLVFYCGYTTSFINHTSIPGGFFILSNIIIFSTLVYTFLISMNEWDKVLNNKAYIYSFKSAGIFDFYIYYGKLSTLILHSWITFFTSSTIIFLFSGYQVNIAYYFFFMFFTILSSTMIILLAAFIKILIKKNYFAQIHVIFVFIMLFIVSGLFTPHYLYSNPIYTILHFLPFGIILDGCRKLLINNIIIFVELLYVSILTITFIITNHFLYKKELAE